MIRTLFALCILAFTSCSALPVHSAEDNTDHYEQRLFKTLADIQNQNHERALTDSREFLRRYPTSKLGQLLYADLLMAKAGVVSSIGSGITSDPKLDDLTFEIKQRLSNQQALAYSGYLPENIIQLADNQPYAILVDQSLSRLYVYRNDKGMPVLETDFFISIGLKGSGKNKRGDQKTPNGVYHVTRYIDDQELPDLYGRGAFPVNYPNVWDVRRKRTGGGIWIHGTPSHTYNRAPWSSNGCVVLSNPDFLQIDQYINPDSHTPVIIAESINWLSRQQWQESQKTMLQQLTRWINDWESNQHELYMQHYSTTGFEGYGRNFKQWEGHKRWVNRDRKNVKVEFHNLAIYQYPGEQNLVMMHYDQDYQSNNLNVSSPKELFWKKQGDQWKIVYEGIREFNKPEDQLVEN